MATSSSDDSCTAPADFQLSAELEDLSPRESPARRKCPLCLNNRRNFYCEQCVRNGDIIGSTSFDSERFSEKQLRLLRLKAEIAQVEEKCREVFQKRSQKDKLICELNSRKEKIKYLRGLIEKAKKNVDDGIDRLDSLEAENAQKLQGIINIKAQTERLKECIIQGKIDKKKQMDILERKKYKLKKFIQSSVKELVKYIFPLSHVEPSDRSICRIDGGQTKYDVIKSALADASGTSYVQGRWITDPGNNLETYYRIAKPTLPASGNYCAYSLWVAATKEGPPGAHKEKSMHNPASNISAALTYVTQLVNVVACYVNVRLPYRVSYEDFCGNEMSDHKFLRKVARLNSNVLHLCFTQNTDHRYLQPRHTIQNLMYLINPETSNLGRIGPVEVDTAIADKLHNELSQDLELNDDDDSASEEEDEINGEWEAVPNAGCPEMTILSATMNQSHQASTTQSVAGGLVTSAAASIASLWRGWTTNR